MHYEVSGKVIKTATLLEPIKAHFTETNKGYAGVVMNIMWERRLLRKVN